MQINKLNRKLTRDLWSSKGLFLAVTIVVFLAVAFFGAMYIAYKNLDNSYNFTYEKLRLADLTVEVMNDASAAEKQLMEIDGIETVTGRMKTEFGLSLPEGKTQSVEARVISLPSTEMARVDTINDVHIVEGEYFSQSDDYTILLEKSFAKYHDLMPGQTVVLDIGEQQIPFKIAGIAVSPEYIFYAKSRQELMASPEVWGVAFIQNRTRDELLNGSTNEYCFLTSGERHEDDIITDVKEVLEPYQITNIVPRDEQASYAGLEMDLEQFQALSEVFPALFIIVGILAIYILLTRIVYNQRTQIGLMRAIGYSRKQVMIHYLGFALAVGMIGSTLGSIAGYFFAESLTDFYATMINLPFTTTEVHWLAIGQGFFLGLLPCVIAGLIPAWYASKILPAEAMRMPAPAAGRRLFLERLFPFLTRLSSLWKIPLRNVFRNRRRSIYTGIGVTIGISLILVSAAMIDSMVDLMDFQFNKIDRHDMRVGFTEARSSNIVTTFSKWAGVEKVEPMLRIPSVLEHGEESYTTLLVAHPSDSELRGIYSSDRKRISLSDEGVMLTEALSDTLNIDEGDTLTITLHLSEETSVQMQSEVIGFVKDPMGSFAYTSLELAQSMIGGMDIITGTLLKVDEAHEDTLREMAFEAGADSVELASETREKTDEMLQGGIAMLWVMLLFGATLAMAIVFTTVTVNLLERRREIATMRTLGESKFRIGLMITIENLMLGFAALIPGMISGYFIAVLFFSMFQGDMFSMDLVVFPQTYVMTVSIVILIMLVSQIPGVRSINRLNLAQVTKEQAN